MKQLLYAVLAVCLVLSACKKDKNEQQAQPLSVKSFWPNSGNAGTIVTIAGTGFRDANDVEVLFNGKAAQVMDARDTVVKVLAPADGTTGMITLKQGSESKEVGQYTFQALSLVGISPANGPAGTNVSIRGMGFSSLSGPAKIMVNGKEAMVTLVTDTMLVAAVPVAAGSGKVAVLVDGKEVTGPDFLFQNITAIKPLKGGKGTQVTITGEGFSMNNTDNHIAFNGKSATVVSATTTQLVVTAPDDVATGPVTVTINGQQTVGNSFTVVPAPIIASVAPLSGPAGADVTIKGEFFSDYTDEVKITFNGIPATISTATEKQIVVKVPASAGTGKIVVTVNDQRTEGPEFKEQNLGIALLSPDNGMDGDLVTITGIGFSTNAADNKVLFNGLPATVTSATATELKVTVPANVSTGNVTVTVGSLSATGPVFGRAGVMTLIGGPTNADLVNMANPIAVDSKGNVYIAVNYGVRIAKITPAGAFSIFAGSTSGMADGVGEAAKFAYISGLAFDQNNDLYVSDQTNNRIRKVTPAGVVSTAGTFGTPYSLAADPLGNIYVGQMYSGVYMFNKATGGSTKVGGFETPQYITAVSPTQVYYATDTWDGNYCIFRIQGTGRVAHAGDQYTWGYQDGTYKTAYFNNYSGLGVTRDGNTIYALNNGALRRVADNMVTTIVGLSTNGFPPSGFVDGSLANARFSAPKGLCVDKDGNVYIADVGNRAVRKVFFK